MIDCDWLCRTLRKSIKLCFEAIPKEHGGDRLYGFALYTVDDLAFINPSASFEAGFRSRRRSLLNDKDRLKQLEEYEISLDSMILGDLRWSCFEWEHELVGGEYFDDVNTFMQQIANGIEVAYEEAYATVAACMVLALRQLRDEGLFSMNAGPNTLTIFCSVPNSENTLWLERESARLLNDAATFERFYEERLAWIEDPDELADPEAAQILARFLEIIAEETAA